MPSHKNNIRSIRPFAGPPTCGSPEKSENTVIVGSKRTIGSMIDYACPDGYMLVGSRSRMCGPSGFWSGDVPTCKCECYFNGALKKSTPVFGFLLGAAFVTPSDKCARSILACNFKLLSITVITD